MESSLGISNFLEEISIVFPILLFSSISLQWSLRKAFLSHLAVLWNSAFKWVYLSCSPFPFAVFFSQLLVRPPQTTMLPFCISFIGDGLSTASCRDFWLEVLWKNQVEMFSDYLDPHICVSKEGSLIFKHRLESHWLRIERQRRTGKIYPFECRVPKNSRER